MSGLGKGITAASIGRLLINAGLDITAIKIDPYLNVDAGTMNPTEHGEVYVLEDGSEVDLDLGNYERFLNEPMAAENNITTGKIYQEVINKERSGDYLGNTVQIIPHITDEIKTRLQSVPDENHDLCLVELGGTIGDIEGMPYNEAIRQFIENNPNRTALCHVTLVPYATSGEQKTKPTQHSVKELRSIGLDPDMIVGRCKDKLSVKTKEKISLFCNVPMSSVYSNPDVSDIYQVPHRLSEENVRDHIIDLFSLTTPTDQSDWGSVWSDSVNSAEFDSIHKTALVGKYGLDDAYLSIYEALKHVGFNQNKQIDVDLIDSENLENGKTYDIKTIKDELSKYDSVIIPGGFGERGTEGKIGAIRYCRENNVRFLGICYGLQLAVIEYARNVADLTNANSTEIDKETNHPVINILPEQHDVEDMGGTMRLGIEKSTTKPNTLAESMHGEEILARHRHRYEVNPEYIDQLAEEGLVFSATKNNRMETIELQRDDHPFFFGCQYHPEFTSRPDDPQVEFGNLVADR